MSKRYYKILLFMKRRQGMTMEAFKDYYESHHAPLALKNAAGLAHYVRRYLEAKPNPDTGKTSELPYDVITELWFKSEKVYLGTVKYLSTTIMSDEIVEDEKQLFDRSSMRMATLIECESELPN